MEEGLGYCKGMLCSHRMGETAEDAGFRVAQESGISASPKDTHDHPEGVCTLPPTYRPTEVDRAKQTAIEESDRLTMKFVKAR
jgi:predicted methyltransferase